MDLQLNGREQQILSAVVEHHVGTGEPVPSRAISGKGPQRLSPASIRHTMAELEERGLLEQPHASAGRIPTELGYRVYVDNLMRQRRVAPADQEFIQQSLDRPISEVSDLFTQVPRVLASLSHQVGVVISPNLSELRLRRIEFVRLAARRVVAIVVAQSGVIHNKVFESGEEHTQEALDKAGRYLTDTFEGSTLPEVREKILSLLAEEQALYDRLHRDALNLGRAGMDDAGAPSDHARVFLDGATNLLAAPEFADLERIKGVFRTIEEKNNLLRLLDRCIEEGGGGVKVLIGSENRLPDLDHCALVASTYGAEGSPRGVLGLIGPTRMEYAKAVALVEYVSRFFGQMLARYKE